jgi:hypothetical protein
MQALMQQLALIQAQTNESPEDRTHRLTECADEAGADPETLYDVEEELRGYGRHLARENTDKVAELETKLAQLGPMIGMDPAAAQNQLDAETGIRLATMQALGRPQVTAAAVKTLHETFQRHGLYDELGTETPEPGALREPVEAGADPEAEP